MKSQRSYTEASRLKVLRFGQSTKNGFCGTLNACNSEYQDADGEGVPDPVAAEVPALEDHSVVDAEVEEVED